MNELFDFSFYIFFSQGDGCLLFVKCVNKVGVGSFIANRALLPMKQAFSNFFFPPRIIAPAVRVS